MKEVRAFDDSQDTPMGGATSEIAAGNAQTARLTVVTSKNPKTLTKRASLVDGALVIEDGGLLMEGHAEVLKVYNLSEFGEVLRKLTASQALIYGLPEAAPVKITTRDAWERAGKPDGEIPRTNECFAYPDGPAIMMIDYDPEEGTAALSPEDLVALITSVAPGLADAEMLHWSSASSWIKNRDGDVWLSELRGQRLYVMVSNGRDIPRAGEVLVARLWLKGQGYIKVSGAGSLLSRTPIDVAVWQPSRLDFAAGAKCDEPLVQERGEPKLFVGKTKVADTVTALPDLTPREEKLVHIIQEEARAEKAGEAEDVREAWLERKARKIAGPKATPVEIETAKAKAKAALETQTLSGDFPLQVKLKGEIKEVSVDEVLDAHKRYDGALTRDALEPDYDGGRIVGKLFLDGPTKTLHSFAHGGITYRLERTKSEIEIVTGKLKLAVDETLEVLRNHPQIYDFGDELVWLEGGTLHPLDQYHLEQRLGAPIQFWSYNAKGRAVLRDPPPTLTKRVLALGKLRGLKPLVAVISAPTLRRDGSVLDVPGYDPTTQLFYHAADASALPKVALHPTKQQCTAALETLMYPFDDFPFVDSVDRGVFLAALLTASVRRILPTAPGFGFDAPVQGSGKTLLAQCIAALAGERNATLYPHTQGRDDEEVRKRLMSFFRTGAAAMVWDNVLGTLDSAALAAALTSETFTDRILGRSESVTLPNTAMFLFTGNNLTLQGDMVRRILVCRIDPRTDEPFARRFDLDPLAHVRESRGMMTAAALTLLRGALTSEVAPPKGRMASFETWSDLVRNTVCWVDQVIAPGEFADPMQAVTRAVDYDPDLELTVELLAALHAKFGNDRFTSSDVHKAVQGEPSAFNSPAANRILEALAAIKDNTARSAALIGRALTYRKDRIAGEYVLRQSIDGHTKKSLWRIEEAG